MMSLLNIRRLIRVPLVTRVVASLIIPAVTKTELKYIEDSHNNPDIERVCIATQPIRLHILQLLAYKDKTYATQIGETLSIDKNIVAYHLNSLE
jgi:hypothetical protein